MAGSETRQDAGSIALAPGVLDALRAAAAESGRQECCGLLLGSGARIDRVRPARNVHPEPCRHFEIDPQVLIDAHRAARTGGRAIVGYYHSHPSGSTAPSATDRACAAHDAKVWAIIADGKIAFWRDLPCGFARLAASEDKQAR